MWLCSLERIRWEGGPPQLTHSTLLVHDHDRAIAGYMKKLRFEPVEDTSARTVS